MGQQCVRDCERDNRAHEMRFAPPQHHQPVGLTHSMSAARLAAMKQEQTYGHEATIMQHYPIVHE